MITYTYDGAGNRTTETTVENGVEAVKTYSYNGRNQLLNVVQTVGGVTATKTVYTYDANGNQLSQTETVYAEEGTVTATVLENTYDLRNQLVRSETADATIVNTYNAAGYRVSKAVTKNGTTTKTYFHYDGNNVIMEADEDGVTAKNTYGGPLLLRTEFNGAEETTYEYMYNAHGDVVTSLTDGTVVATYYYDSFGNVLDQTGNVSNSILYAGYQYDVETGLYYINARMYDPVTARFLQADTYLGNLNDPLSLNLYTYCLNNPHKYVDPSGHSVLLAFLLVVAVSFAVGAGMEYINQRFIEQRDVINYDLILYEGIFNAVIAAVSFGTANLGATAARQGLRLTARTTTRAVGRSMAFGAMEGATEEIGRQLVEGKTFSEIDYGQVAFSATINGITGGIGGYSGAKKEAFDYARQATKSNVRSMAQMGVGVDDVVEAGTSGSYARYAGISDNAGVYRSSSKKVDNAIPNVESAIINSKKLTEYALNPNHPVGGNKAKVFESALGYNQSNADDLMKQIYEKLPSREVVLGNLDVYGQRYTVDIPITGPNGRTVNVRTGWIFKTDSNIPELTTIYVKNSWRYYEI